MFQSIGMGEMLVIGILALVVLGPQDLLTTFRAAGKWVGRMQRMAREFSKAMNDAADQAGVSEINKTLKSAANPARMGTDALKDAAGLGPSTKKLADKKAEDAKAWAEKARANREKRAEEAAAAKAAAETTEVSDEMAADMAEAEADAAAAPDPGQVDATYRASTPARPAPRKSDPVAAEPAGDDPEAAPKDAKAT